MAYLCRARAKVNLADYAGAKAAAQEVPEGYNKVVSASETAANRFNRVFPENSVNGLQYRWVSHTGV